MQMVEQGRWKLSAYDGGSEWRDYEPYFQVLHYFHAHITLLSEHLAAAYGLTRSACTVHAAPLCMRLRASQLQPGMHLRFNGWVLSAKQLCVCLHAF